MRPTRRSREIHWAAERHDGSRSGERRLPKSTVGHKIGHEALFKSCWGFFFWLLFALFGCFVFFLSCHQLALLALMLLAARPSSCSRLPRTVGASRGSDVQLARLSHHPKSTA